MKDDLYRQIWKYFFRFFFPIAVIVVSSLYGLYYFQYVKLQTEVLKSQLVENLEFQHLFVEDIIETVIADLKIIATTPALQSYVNQELQRPNSSMPPGFISFSKYKGFYDQIRILDKTGMEAVRVNLRGVEPYWVRKKDLQYKGDRYYFRDTIKLNQGEVFISPMDLNIEHGQIEQPLKPMIRFGMPLYDFQGTKQGVIILNYLGKRIIQTSEHLYSNLVGRVCLLNPDGYWLKGERPEDEWGFMFQDAKKVTFANRFPTAWNIINKSSTGQFYNDHSLFTYSTIHIPQQGTVSGTAFHQLSVKNQKRLDSTKYFWKVVSRVPLNQLHQVGELIVPLLLVIMAILLAAGALVSWLLAVAHVRRCRAEKSLLESHGKLEKTVLERTAELRISNEGLRESKQEWEKTFDAIGDMVVILDKDMRIVRANKATYEMLGREPGEFTKKFCYEVFREECEPCQGCPGLETLEDSKIHSAEVLHELIEKCFLITSAPLFDKKDQLTGIIHCSTNITSLKNLESQLRQAQKMESIGTLAGGIAHDFNNILTPILGFSEMVMDGLPKGSELRQNQEEVVKAARRASKLVKQILTFSRQGEQDLRPLQVQVVIKEALKLLRASIPTSIKIKDSIDSTCGSVLADPTQIHQIVMNLCTNAYHAMRETGGVLAVSLAPVVLGADEMKKGLLAGAYVEMKVSDTGHGMAQLTIDKIFDPYFTTKAKGEGTGLGLSVVHGIVTSFGGQIRVYSEPGKGTTFEIYLPVIESRSVMAEIDVATPLPRGEERILLVDDEKSIVRLERMMLEDLGYQVKGFTECEKALKEIRTQSEKIDLVITDMYMPNLTGIQLAQKVLNVRKDMPVILCSGFSEWITEEKAMAAGVHAYIMKPIVKSKLAHVVRKVLDKEYERCPSQNLPDAEVEGKLDEK